MRHEIRDSNSLHFTMEVVIGGTPATGLSPSIRILSVKNSEYWDFGAGPAWDTYDNTGVGNSTGTMVPVDNVGLPGVYEFDATNALIAQDIFHTLPSNNAEEGYIVRMEESTSGLLEYTYVVVNDVMTSSATVSGTVDANVVEWLGTTALGTGGIPDANVVSSITVDANVVSSITVDANVISSITVDANIVSSAITLDADVTVWSLDVGATTGLPQVTVAGWSDSPGEGNAGGAGGSGAGGHEGWTFGKYTPLDDGAGTNVDYVIPNINVSDWNETGATLTVGDATNLPQISVKGWWADDFVTGVDTFSGTEAHTLGQVLTIDDGAGGTKDYIHPNINVSDWNGPDGETAPTATLNIGDPSSLPLISVHAWSSSVGGLETSGDPLGGVYTVPGDTYITWTQDTGPLGNLINRPNVRTELIADDAIDEDAIQVDSVTYDGLSSSAVAEIVEGIWNADVRSPIDNSDEYDGSSHSGAEIGSMGHAMLTQYITQHTVHNSADGFTPYHACAHDDSDGKRFYSSSIVSDSLSDEQIPGYIDRTAILTRSIFGATPEDYEQYLVRITGVEIADHGQCFVIQMVDEDESSIPGGIIQSTDALIVKAETDPTMHEVAHEVWEEEVADHDTKHTFGMFNRIIAGLAQYNHRITDSTYDESGRLLACRLVVYPSAADAKAETNALTTVVVASEYDEKQNMTTFLTAEEGTDVDPVEPE